MKLIVGENNVAPRVNAGCYVIKVGRKDVNPRVPGSEPVN